MIAFLARLAATGGGTLLITAQDHTLSQISPNSIQDAECGIRYETDGDTWHVKNSLAGDVQLEDWLLSGGTASDWYARATRTGGTKASLDLGNLNTWEQLGVADRRYVITDTSPNDVAETIQLTIDFSNDGGTSIYTSVDVSLSANTTSV